MSDDGELRWLRPSPRLGRLRHLQWGLVAVALVTGGVLLSLATSPRAGGVLAVVGVGAAGLLDALAQRRVGAWGYTERAEDLLVRRGLLFRRLSVVPYGRMQIVDVTAGPFERVFGLATVRLHTAAATSDARIPGLAAPEAARLRDQLSTLGEHQATGL